MWAVEVNRYPAKKKMALYLVAALFAGGVAVAWTVNNNAAAAGRAIASRGAAEPAPADAPTAVTTSPLPPLTLAADPNLGRDVPSGGEISELFYKMLILVLVVIGLWVASSYFSKRFTGRASRLSGRRIHVAEITHLGPRKALYLVDVGRRKLLIGTTGDTIAMLADVTDSLLETEQTEQKEDFPLVGHNA